MSKRYENDEKRNENTIGYRVSELRLDKGWNQKELADQIHVARSQISRLESGSTTNVSTEILVALAKLFHVSTDYLLGLTPIRVPKSYEISTLGLSEEAVRRLIMKDIDADILNRLLEHRKFPRLCALIRNYFDGITDTAMAERNCLIDLVTEPLTELVKSNPANKADIINDVNRINSTKISGTEADIEKIKSILISILRDIKAGLAAQQPTTPLATEIAFKDIIDHLPDKLNVTPTPEEMASAVTAHLRNVMPMNRIILSLFQKLMHCILSMNWSNNNLEE